MPEEKKEKKKIGRGRIGKACKVLGLPLDFCPATRISQIFYGIETEEMVSYLRTSADESAQVICALYDRLSPAQRNAINIDYMIAAAGCRDPHAIAGMICETYSRAKSLEANFIASRESPEVMKSAVINSKLHNGFQHARLVLQTAGIAPVPRNQFTINNNRIDKIDNSKHLTLNGVPTHQGVITEVGEILRQLPQNVTSSSHSTEDSSDRDGQRDKT